MSKKKKKSNKNKNKLNRVFFESPITQESSYFLMSMLDELDLRKKTKVYFSSVGGFSQYAAHISEAISEFKEVELHLDGICCSAAFDILLKHSGQVTMGDYFLYGMVHKSDIDVSMKAVRAENNNVPDGIVFRDYDRINGLSSPMYKEVLTEKEYKDYEKSKEVFLDRKRMKKIIKIINKRNGCH